MLTVSALAGRPDASPASLWHRHLTEPLCYAAGMASQDKKLRNMGRLSDEQDDALDQCADRLSRQRGSRVPRADVTREALRMLAATLGVEWPVG